MNVALVIIIGLVGGALVYARREWQRRAAVLSSVSSRGGLGREDFVAHYSGFVPEQVSAAVFDFLSNETKGNNVDPNSDLVAVYRFNGDLLEECLDALQAALGVSDADYKFARSRQESGIQTVEDLTIFVNNAWEAARRRGDTQPMPSPPA